MQLYSIETGNFKLDGGAMFGVVPKVLWNKQYPADEKNLCNWAMRSMLIVDGDRKILIDNGIGDTLDKKFLGHFYLNGDYSLESSLKKHDYSATDITDVILTHLHFDHCGGNVKRKADGTGFEAAFPNAKYWINGEQYNCSMQPNTREKASFYPYMVSAVADSGQMILIDKEVEIVPGISLRFYNGHTDGQIIPFIKYNDRTIVFMGDLLPSVAHLPLSWVMAYDMRPLLTIQEKETFLNEAVDNDYILFFEHDIYYECCDLQKTDKGIRVKDTFKLEEVR